MVAILQQATHFKLPFQIPEIQKLNDTPLYNYTGAAL